MKQFFKTFFASLLAVIVAGLILFGLVIGGISSLMKSAKSAKAENTVKVGSVLLIDLDKTFHEQRETSSFALGSDENASAGLYDLTKALHDASTDDRIKGLLIKTGGSSAGWATLQAVRNAVVDFKTSRKLVYAYGEDMTQRDYYVASAADSVFLNPVGDFELKGMAAQLQFFKGTLDKLGVQPEIFYAGKFKSATEPFRETKMTEANRTQLTALLNDLWGQYLTAASQHAHTDTATVGQWARSGAVLFPEDAQRLKLVDRLTYWDEVERLIKKKTDRKEDEKLEMTALNDYAPKADAKAGTGGRIAVLFAEGDITDGPKGDDYQIASETFVKNLRKVRDNEDIKAVVLRINSPGGSARASEIILREIQLLKQKKHVVVSMGDVAASGGYYIAAAADSIFAQPTTLTGSIGVFTMMFNAQSLLTNKLGVTFDAVRNTPYADFPTATRPLNDDERLRVQRGVDTIYALFKRRVAQGRRMQEAMVDSIAQGRVWTGRAAMGIGLVDGLGGLDRAVQSAAKLAGLTDYRLSTYPEPVDKFQSMLRKIRSTPGTSKMQQAAQEVLGVEAGQAMETLRRMQRMNGKAQMAMPFRFTAG